jgi:hypothetical protein
MRWRNSVAEHWTKLNFGSVHTETIGNFHQFRVQVYLGVLEPEAVLVEVYANSQNGGPPFRQPIAGSPPRPSSGAPEFQFAPVALSDPKAH